MPKQSPDEAETRFHFNFSTNSILKVSAIPCRLIAVLCFDGVFAISLLALLWGLIKLHLNLLHRRGARLPRTHIRRAERSGSEKGWK